MRLFSDEYLAHFGVPGMKWGVRNDPVGFNRAPGFKSGSKDDPSLSPKEAMRKIMTDTENKLKNSVQKMGELETRERVARYAYDDAVAISKRWSGNDPSKWANWQREQGMQLEKDLNEYYSQQIDNYVREFAASRKKVRHGELTHFGVPGMKWGVRNEKEPVGRRRKSSVGKSAENTTKKSTNRPSTLSALTFSLVTAATISAGVYAVKKYIDHINTPSYKIKKFVNNSFTLGKSFVEQALELRRLR